MFGIARVMFFFSWSDEVRATCVPLSFHLEYSEDGYDLSFGLLLIGDGGVIWGWVWERSSPVVG